MSSPLPLREALREPINRRDIRRMWVGIERRWDDSDATRRGARGWWGAVAVAAAVALGAATSAAWQRWLYDPPAARPVTLAPLALEDGAPISRLAAPTASDATVRFNEGSRVELQASAQLDPLINAPDAVTWLLSRGRVNVDVKPGGPRHWSFECGLATVDVVGTRFTLERNVGRLTIDVAHGVVLVRGERVPDRVQRLGAGDHLEVREVPQGQPATRASEPAVEIDTQTSAPSGSSVHAAPRVAAAASPWPVNPPSSAEPAGCCSNNAMEGKDIAPATELLRRSDEARAAGRLPAAAALLAELVRAYPQDARASASAFTLGKIRLDALSDPTGAAEAFASAIRLGLPADLIEDAYARLVEARSRAGDSGGARAAAEAYDARFPGGTRRPAMNRWLSAR